MTPLTLTVANQQKNMDKLSTNLQKAQESAIANNVKIETPVATNPNSVERTPEQDTCSFSNKGDDAVNAFKTLAKSASLMYLIGVGIGFCPGLFMLGAAAFLFANKNNDSFKEKITQAMSQNMNAMNVLQQKAAQNMQANQAPQQAEKTQPEKAQTATNPIEAAEPEKEQKPMTPLEKAEQRYNKAQNYQSRAEMNLQKKEEANKVAEEKLQLAQAKLDKAQAEYDKAKAEVKMQMTDRMMKLQQNVATKEANAAVTREKRDVAQALLNEANVKLQNAQIAFEDAKAEEIVNVD